MDASDSLSHDQAASYTLIIDDVLAKADLNTISAKQIRKGLQAAVPYDITPQKAAINKLIIQRFDKAHAERESPAESAIETVEKDPETEMVVEPPAVVAAAVVKSEPKRPPHTNGVAAKKAATSSTEPSYPEKRPAADSDDETPASQASPPPAKKKRKNEDFDADAALAKKLQAEELARSRSTRGGGGRKAAPPPKKKSKKKSKDRISADDDSDLEGSRPSKNVNRNTGFHKLLSLSPPLSALFGGEAQLSRPQATKRLWAYIKEKDLQDPSNRRTIICDEPMRAVFKTDKINMFAMTKAMSQNMYADGE